MEEIVKLIDRLIVPLILFFYLTSTYLSATHIHKNSLEHNTDCKVCIVVKNLHNGAVPAVELNGVTTLNNYMALIFNQQQTIQILLKGFNAQAPPIFS
jgi:c-di-AMP phosphodiesterase-like protein